MISAPSRGNLISMAFTDFFRFCGTSVSALTGAKVVSPATVTGGTNYFVGEVHYGKSFKVTVNLTLSVLTLILCLEVMSLQIVLHK